MFELLTTQQMAEIDDIIWNEMEDGFHLIERAGTNVAQLAITMFPEDKPIAVLCGAGNNGADGYIAATLLKEAGRNVTCFAKPIKNENVIRASDLFTGAVKPFQSFDPLPFGGIIDALYGAGLNAPLSAEDAELVAKANLSKIPIISIDIPSGVDATSGEVNGVAIQARATVTFFRKKTGHLLQPARSYCGIVHLTDIGINDEILLKVKSEIYENNMNLWINSYPYYNENINKFTKGHAAVFSGSLAQAGASRLSATAALRSGAGAVTLISPNESMQAHAAQITSLMLHETRNENDAIEFIKRRKINTAVIGPGYGSLEMAKQHVLALLKNDVLQSLIIDADAITAFHDAPSQLFKAIAASKTAVILTPHEGEFKRIFPVIASRDISKLEKAVSAASLSNALIVYKGPDTIIADNKGRAVINANGTSLLATAGSGDVLAGIIAGLVAQGMPVFEAASAAVWMHAEAARQFGAGLIAEDIPQQLPAIITKILSHRL